MRRFVTRAAAVSAVVAAVAGGGWATRDRWGPWLRAADATPAKPAPKAGAGEGQTVRLSDRAVEALGLKCGPAAVGDYWKTVTVPGTVVDRPGLSDRGVTAPVAGVVARVHAFAGETVRPGDPLVTLRLVSEYVQASQGELFKAAKELEIAREQTARLTPGVVPEARIAEARSQEARLAVSIQTHRHELLARGLSPAQADGVQAGKFVSEVTISAPPTIEGGAAGFEVQAVKAELGQQVQAGQLLADLADHQALLIEGRAFRHEVPLVEAAAREGWAVTVAFGGEDGGWPAAGQAFVVRSIGNAVDPESRTIPFYLPLGNQSRPYDRDGKTYLAWRYRPGQRVRVEVPAEKLAGVIVLPAGAVVRDGTETFVFRQNGVLFDRKPVRVVWEDRASAVLANDGGIAPGAFVALGNAAALNRALKAQNAAGGTTGGHWHADGTYHEAHD